MHSCLGVSLAVWYAIRMKQLLILVGILAVWLVLVRFVFPKCGIRG